MNLLKKKKKMKKNKRIIIHVARGLLLLKFVIFTVSRWCEFDQFMMHHACLKTNVQFPDFVAIYK